MDGNPIRDNGPYRDSQQALRQFEAVAATAGLPVLGPLAEMVISEVLLAAGVDLSPYERDVIAMIAGQNDPTTCQVITGLIVRAHITGSDAAMAMMKIRTDVKTSMMPTRWAELFEALTILAKHQNNESSPFICSHDTLTVCSDPSTMSADELERLEALHFIPDIANGVFTSFIFGNA